MTKRFVAIDLFSGAGGLTLGLRNAGFRVAAGVEIDPVACATYERNHPKSRAIIADISQVSAADLLKIAPARKIHVVVGCAPCQGFSSLTRKHKREDPRNQLVLEMARIIEEVRPDAVMMENVPGLATRGKALFDEFLSRLRCAGYYVDHRIIQMADYGVPQNRRRLVLLGGNGFMIPFPAPTHARSPEPDSGLESWVSVRAALPRGKAPRTLSQSWSSGGPQAHNWHVVRDLRPQTKIRLKAAMPGETWLHLAEDVRPVCHRGDYVGFTNVYGRMAWDRISGTITSGCTTPCKGRFGHPDRRRTTISVREAATIQTFPESYCFDTDQIEAVCEMIGNAVPPLFAHRVAGQIMSALTAHYRALDRR